MIKYSIEIQNQKERRTKTLKNGKEKEEHQGKRKFTGKKQGMGEERREEDWRQGRKHRKEVQQQSED
jgi:hypothetical protein